MTPSSYSAAKLEPAQRMDLAIETLAKDANLSKFASANDVSRKFVYQQRNKAQNALNSAFAQTAAVDGVLFSLPVTKAWLHQVALALTLTCHSSYRGVMEFLRDILGVTISLGSVHNLHQVTAQRAAVINQTQDLCQIRGGPQ